MKTNYIKTGEYTTGTKRGYIKVADQRVESEIKPVYNPKKYRGNARWAMQQLIDHDATHYTITWYQVPNSTQYCFAIYTGYKEV